MGMTREDVLNVEAERITKMIKFGDRGNRVYLSQGQKADDQGGD